MGGVIHAIDASSPAEQKPRTLRLRDGIFGRDSDFQVGQLMTTVYNDGRCIMTAGDAERGECRDTITRAGENGRALHNREFMPWRYCRKE